jgi:hypothetical protein
MKRILVILALAIALAPFATFAEEEYSTKAEDLGGVIRMSVVSQNDIYVDNSDVITADGLRHKDIITIDAQLTNKIRAVIKMKFTHWFKKNGINNPENEHKLDNILNQAYIEIREIGGIPMAIVIGKHHIAFGQTFPGMPLYDNDPMFLPSLQDQVIGFTVSLADVGFFDLIQISGFETGAGDLDIGTFDGGSVRFSKQVTDKIKAQVSYMYNGHGDMDEEHRGSIGFVYESGEWTAWMEGIYLNGSAKYPDSDFGITAGVRKQWGPGKVVVQLSYVHEALAQIGLGYIIAINEYLTFGPEVRYTNYNDGRGDDVSIVMRLTYKFKAQVNLKD